MLRWGSMLDSRGICMHLKPAGCIQLGHISELEFWGLYHGVFLGCIGRLNTRSAATSFIHLMEN